MINILIHAENGIEQVMAQTDIEGVLLYPYPFATVTEMQDNSFMIVLDDPNDWDALEIALLNEGALTVIGTYNEDGTHHIWNTSTHRNHTIYKYKSKLNNIKKYDQHGNMTEDRPPTELEALETNVNNIYGWNKRKID